MTTLAILLIFCALVGYGLNEYYQIKLKSRPDSTPQPVIDKLTDFLTQYSDSSRFLDMGSGWGKVVLHVAKKLPDWSVDGIEASPTPWFIANCRTIGKNLQNYRFFIGKMQDHKLKNYDVIYLNQSPKILQMLMPRLVQALREGTFIITYAHPLPRLPQGNILYGNEKNILYLYRGLSALPLPEPKAEAPLPPVIEEETVTQPEATPAAVIVPTDTVVAGIDEPPGTDAPEQVQLPLNYTD
jgi:hypothetical protein